MKPSCKIVFFGNERLSSGFTPDGAPTLEALIAKGYQIAAVVANYERPLSRKARPLEVQEIAQNNNIPVLLPQKIGDIAPALKAYGADLGVLVAYGKIIPQSVIDIFPKGIINIHPSLLPLYRGSTPIEQAILDGAAKTGVSIMQLVKAMDAGPIYAQAELELKVDESKQELTSKLLNIGRELLIQNLPKILDGSLTPWPQDDSKATYTRLLSKEDSNIDLAKPASQLEREIRAFQTWPKSRLRIFDKYDVVVKKARVVNDTTAGLLVLACGQGSFLEITQLTAPSGRTMSGQDFMRGYGPK